MKFHLKHSLFHNFVNIPGWHTNRKIVVIESDDWGSIRMPSREVYNRFLKLGIRVDNDMYCKYDCLATKDDLSALFEVLTSVKDKNERYAVLTADAVVANPDFERIRQSDFSQYFYEPFTETLKKSKEHSDAFELWQEGMDKRLFRPQFHGREHLNIKKWLFVLNEGTDKVTKQAFNLGTFGLTQSVTPFIQTNYMGAFDSALQEDINEYAISIKEGLDLFENLFGYRSKSFIATTYTWSPALEPYLKRNGVDYLQGLVTQRMPLNEGTHFTYKKTNYQGKTNKNGMTYLMRNCFFEPTHFRDRFDVVNDCLNRIHIAFRWGKAAVISSHRLNFVGAIDPTNRTKNLSLLKELLREISKRWPDVEFMSSDELGNIMSQKND